MNMRLDLAAPGRAAAENIAWARLAEQCGWRGFWIGETAGADAIATAGAVAARLERMRVGTAIVPMQTRDPLQLAMAASTIDPIAPGGFVLGLGTSTPVVVEGWHATPWGDSPLRLTRECVGLVRRFLSGERVTTETGRWRYRRARLAAEPPARVPIYLAALNDRMLEVAGAIADGVVLNFVTVEDVRHARARIAAGAARVGRALENFELMVLFRASVTDDYASARQRYQRELLTYAMAPVYARMFARQGHGQACRDVQALWRAGERQQALNAVPDALIEARALIGAPAALRDRLAGYAAAGMDSALVAPVPLPDRDRGEDIASTIQALA